METDRAATALFDDCHAIMREAADEIERLRRDYSSICSEMRRMMEERDEARREVCRIYADTYGSVGLVAERRGWDCFKEASDER